MSEIQEVAAVIVKAYKIHREECWKRGVLAGPITTFVLRKLSADESYNVIDQVTYAAKEMLDKPESL